MKNELNRIKDFIRQFTRKAEKLLYPYHFPCNFCGNPYTEFVCETDKQDILTYCYICEKYSHH